MPPDRRPQEKRRKTGASAVGGSAARPRRESGEHDGFHDGFVAPQAPSFGAAGQAAATAFRPVVIAAAPSARICEVVYASPLSYDLAQIRSARSTLTTFMRPLLHPSLINGRFGDPALYVETLFEKRAILFDLGDISDLSPRKIQRLEHVFVSHAHIDHFIGFDHLLRVLVGRDKTIKLNGPKGFIGHVHHKLRAYQWNLVDRYAADLVFVVTEVDSLRNANTARFRLKTGFAAEAVSNVQPIDGALCSEPGFRISTAVLDHRTPCLAFAIEETAHVNVWKNRLAELGLPVGAWLHELKRAVVESRPDEDLVRIGSPSTAPGGRMM